MPHPSVSSVAVPWLLRIPEVFTGFAESIIAELGAVETAKLGAEYHLVKVKDPAVNATIGLGVTESKVGMLVQWNLPVHHSWPCNPQKMEGFIEKAAQTLWRKFGNENPQALLIGQLHPSAPSPYYKMLASNLRGRALQLFPKFPATTAEEQLADQKTLFCLVGKEGLFCGMHTPRAANGLYAGGTKFISQDGPETISRAGAKIAEALHYLQMYRPPFARGSHWVELGASPGGMTSELLAREQKVTAVDRAPLDARLNNHSGLTFVKADVATFKPKQGTIFDAILSDLNGAPQEAIGYVTRLMSSLRMGGMVVFTLKAAGAETFAQTLVIYDTVLKQAEASGLKLFARTHLTYNRREFTLFFERVR